MASNKPQKGLNTDNSALEELSTFVCCHRNVLHPRETITEVIIVFKGYLT